ncbi:MAG: hypothetical protein KJ646_02655 [Nanoarchaeota archaeon]|nr:hypothetical protein [Nanoarchaeota archaeon]MBU4116440.1 hypothetical protein [Nanoarchaeota archaeon]MBU4539596.1 hypothetical protein [Bacteroidota bacterium]
MKVIKVLSKKVGDMIYFKFIINIPKEIIKKSGLIGKNLKVKAEKDKIIIEKE